MMCSSGMQLVQFALFQKNSTQVWRFAVQVFYQRGPALSVTVVLRSSAVFLMKVRAAIAIIPARFNSTRFPGKPLVRIDGKTLIEHVYRRVEQAALVSRILVATDDQRIAEAVQGFGGTAVMTRNDHPSGTDRLAEVAETLDSGSLVLNVQGDEPMIEPADIDQAITAARREDAEIV